MTKRWESKTRGARRMTQLLADTSGNAMMIMAIAMIPIVGIIGSAFDMGRAYMTKTRLQQACDAGALAGRRAMTTSTFDAASKTQADNFFYFNFQHGTFGTSGLTWNPRGTGDGQVEADASVAVPMTIMRLFDKPTLTLNVDCEAILEVANTDIMFVLDVTGSMSCPAATTNSDCSLVEASNSKMNALRNAVVSFYGTIHSAIGNDARLRIGFVPYSTTVNVGNILKTANPNWLVTSWNYQSRERVNVGLPTVGSWPSSTSSSPSWSSVSSGYTTYSTGSVEASSKCTTTNHPYPTGTIVTYGTESVGTPTTSTTDGAVTTTTVTTRTATKWSSWRLRYNGTSPNGNCITEGKTQTRTETKTDKTVDDYDWYYKQWTPPADIFSKFKAFESVIIPIENSATKHGPATSGTFQWDGCIEERKTVANATFSPIPDGAYDLDIDKIPDSEDTKWAPAWKEIIWRRNSSGTARPDPGTKINPDGNGDTSSGLGIFRVKDATSTDRNSYACPKAAQKLKVMTLAEVKAYVNAGETPTTPPVVTDFKARGYTYHDVGMIWGARLLSPDGIFGSENKEVPSGEVGAGKPINRHIIFMTDGQMDPDAKAYGLYGLEMLDGRINTASTSTTDNATRHNNRFKAVCAAAKAKNITIWVVAYASTLNAELTACASSGKGMSAVTDTDLDNRFKEIAAKIAELRLRR